MHWLPEPKNVVAVHEELVRVFAEDNDPISPPGVKSPDLLESACSRPRTALGDTEKYPTLAEKMAALFHSLTKNHAFHNGNKRTALVTLLTALNRNDHHLAQGVTDDMVYDLVIAVTADEFPTHNHGLSTDDVVQELASWLRSHMRRVDPKLSSMTLKEFVRRCEQAGARSKPVKGGSISILNGRASIKISKSTRHLDGPAISRYLKMLNLGESQAGIVAAEFQAGTSPEREQIYRYITVLRRLAKT
jgi:death-on-curing family protein